MSHKSMEKADVQLAMLKGTLFYKAFAVPPLVSNIDRLGSAK